MARLGDQEETFILEPVFVPDQPAPEEPSTPLQEPVEEPELVPVKKP